MSDVDAAQLPRATSSATRSANLLRTPLSSSFARKYSDDADKKVRGPVIGIDLGMNCPYPLSENFDRMLTIFSSQEPPTPQLLSWKVLLRR